jgi:dTDP-4-dehydrorhamnose reductase
MLGHRLWIHLSREHETWVTIRRGASVFPNHSDFNRAFVIEHINALDWNDLTRVMAQLHPDVVINCVGLIKQHPSANDPILALETNALLPHRLAALCQATQSRLIHISTDCVFSGQKGSYTEEDPSDAQDLYGRTKYLGETSAPHAVTLRTSIIGPELHTRYGLLEWFLSQKQAVTGFQKAIFSGFTTDELSRIIAEEVIPNPKLQGLYHLSSAPISKYDLLQLFNHAYGRGLIIEPQSTFTCDRSLISDRFKSATGYTAPAWPQMVASMAQKHASYYLDKEFTL